MVQDAMRDEGLRLFTFPTWDADRLSWDEYLHVVEESYAQHRCGGEPRDVAIPTAREATPAAQVGKRAPVRREEQTVDFYAGE